MKIKNIIFLIIIMSYINHSKPEYFQSLYDFIQVNNPQ